MSLEWDVTSSRRVFILSVLTPLSVFDYLRGGGRDGFHGLFHFRRTA